MNETQAGLLAMYKDIAKVLNEHGIRFYVLYGTAIGAVRHNGFIPWDDDIDMGVWDIDLPAAQKALKAELDPAKYYYHEPTADTHPHVLLRVENMEERLKAKDVPFIDIFPIEKYPDKKFRRMRAWCEVWGLHIWVTILNHESSIGLHRRLTWFAARDMRKAKRIPEEGANTAAVFSTNFAHELFPREWYGEPVMHPFEDTEVPLPQEWDKLLTAEFGDYMTPPPEDKRGGAQGFPLSAWKDYHMEQNGIPCRKTRDI